MNIMNKTLLILMIAASIGLAGCGNSAGTPRDSTAAADTTAAADSIETAAIDTSDAVVSYLGPAGTYTEEAAMFFFPEAKTMMPEGTVDEAIADVMNGTADFAVIPQENTLGGAVTN